MLKNEQKKFFFKQIIEKKMRIDFEGRNRIYPTKMFKISDLT